MKKITSFLFAALAVAAVSCEKPETDNGDNGNEQPTEIAVESVTLDESLKDGLALEVGATYSLVANVLVLPENATDKTVTYSSSDEAKATVCAEGLVTAVAEGTAEITAKAGDKEASFTLTVTEPAPVEEVLITSLAFGETEKEYELASFEGSVDLMSMLTVEPENHTEGVVFESSNPEAVEVNAEGQMTVKALTEGVTITAKAADHAEVAVILTVKAYKMTIGEMDYPRHVGDGTLEPTDEREYLMTMTCSVDPLKTVGGRNNSLHAMLDDKPIIARAGTSSKDDPTEANGTAFCFEQMKSVWEESAATTFTIDMQEQKKVDYFRVMNISKDRDDCQVRICGFDMIEGSNDGVNFTEIARDFTFDNCKSLGTINEQNRPEYNLETENIKFSSELNYRYLRFSFWTNKHFVRKIVGGTQGGTAQIAEFYLGYSKAEIKVYTE